MFWRWAKKQPSPCPNEAQKPEKQPEKEGVSAGYEVRLSYLKSVFEQDDPIQFRELQTAYGRFCLVYCDGLVDSATIDAHLIRPLLQLRSAALSEGTETILQQAVELNTGKKTAAYAEMVQGITCGDTLLLGECMEQALLFSAKNVTARAVSEPEGEKILSGPREGFTEVLLTNLSMVRRRLRTGKLKMRYRTLGTQTHTQLCVAYLEDVVNTRILQELYRRLDSLEIDGILDANYITELIRDKPWSPFRSIGYTERPDVVVAKLLEGRIAVFVDGTPVVLTLPYLFIENFQSNEDYYLNFYYTTFSRLLRIFGFFLCILVPAIYVAVVAFHHEMLPSPLMISISIERHGVPLPAAPEAFFLLLVFDILRETGLRMPTNVGQTLSIVGALVVGQAAVEARLVAAPMIIIVALTGITSLLIPKMNAPVLFLRFGFLALASCLGFFGITLGCALLLGHVLSLSSFGVLQLTPDRKLRYQEVKDTFLRAPWWQMYLRPAQLARNKTRQNPRGEA